MEKDWISVKQHLPAIGKKVLIWIDGSADVAYMGRAWWMWDEKHHVPEGRCVSHWMDLPKPPVDAPIRNYIWNEDKK